MNNFYSVLFFGVKILKTLEKLISNVIRDTIKLLKEDVSHGLFYHKKVYFHSSLK